MMTNYSLETKENFTVLGIGTELKSDYTDYAGINNEKTAFWNDMAISFQKAVFSLLIPA